jgi:hypothetical protein
MGSASNFFPHFNEKTPMRIERFWTLALCLTLSAASAASAKDTPTAAACRPDNPTRELAVDARAVERPLMKYRLLPAEYELHRGNAAPILLRLCWEQIPYFSKDVPKFGEYLDVPLSDARLRSGHEIFAFYRILKRAAYRQTADWEYPIGEEPAATILLPDVQGARFVVGNGLAVWIRQRLARGQLEEAREGILVGLAVSRHYARTPFLITQLVCAHIDTLMLSRLEELVSQPDCPNLYWALSALPRPLVDVRPSIELEQRFLEMTVPGLDDLDQVKTPDQWTARARGVLNYFLEAGSSAPISSDATKPILSRLEKRARAELSGWFAGGPAQVARMSSSEAVVRWLVHINQDHSQEASALMSLEPPAAIPRLGALEKRIAQFHSELGLPNLYTIANTPGSFLATHRLERRIDALRVVEGIRDYAARHDRQLPASLDAISDTPMPLDPLTGKPFHYEVKADEATLSAEGFPANGRMIAVIRYRIKIRK